MPISAINARNPFREKIGEIIVGSVLVAVVKSTDVALAKL